jgi:hypothetical protein
MSRLQKILGSCVIAGLIAGGEALAVTLTPIASGFNSPIGIDYQPSSGKLILSVNYFGGGSPNNLDVVTTTGSHSSFSALSGLTDELKICTAKATANGFTVGEVFTGNGNAGEIVRISANGATVQNPWVTLSGESGLLRGSLFVDNTGVFGGALIAVTTSGGVWKITSGGTATLLVNLGTHLEGVITVPNNSTKYGPWAGKILVGAENAGLIYTVSTTGATASYNLGIAVEDIDLIPANQNFYGVAFAAGQILSAPASDFTGIVDDILFNEESGYLWSVHWNGTSFVKTQQTTTAVNWEHMTFAPIQIATLHLQAGSFPSSGTFQFTVKGPSSQAADIEGSTDLISWTYLGSDYFDANNSFTFSDTGVSGVAYKYYRASIGAFHSDNIYGFDRFTAPAGDSLIANPLNTAANTAAGVIPNPPHGTRLYKWNEATSSYNINTFEDDGFGVYVWSTPGMTLAPGEGVILRTPTSTTVPLSFMGDVLQGTLNTSVPALPTKSIRSSKVPQAGALQSLLGFAPAQNDVIYRMTPGAGTYTSYTYANGSWSPSQPSINVGESFWIYTGTASTWSRSFSGW